MTWINSRCEAEQVTFPDFVRRVVAYSHLHMPEGWVPPTEEA